jgi:hypothetical protein
LALAAQESDAVAALEKLAAELSSRGFDPMITAAAGGWPALVVSNPRVPALSENSLADGDWVLWPWADRIGQVTALGAVADTIARVLATGT